MANLDVADGCDSYIGPSICIDDPFAIAECNVVAISVDNNCTVRQLNTNPPANESMILPLGMDFGDSYDEIYVRCVNFPLLRLLMLICSPTNPRLLMLL